MTGEELNQDALFEQGMARLSELLGPAWRIDRRTDGKEAHRSGGDIIVTMHAKGESSYAHLLVDVKLAGVSPRIVEETLLAKLDLLRQLNQYTTLLLLTPWLSRPTQRLLRKHDISYLDLMGNVSLRIPRPAIVIHTEGAMRAPQALATEPRKATLAGPKAGRLVRLLTDVRPRTARASSPKHRGSASATSHGSWTRWRISSSSAGTGESSRPSTGRTCCGPVPSGRRCSAKARTSACWRRTVSPP